MTRRWLPTMLALVAMLVGSSVGAPASGSDTPVPRVRVMDAPLGALLDRALQISPTVRTLVARLSATDVVVFLACERDPRVRLRGRLNFMTAAGGFRYLAVRIKTTLPRDVAVAVLAHELQHALEIAGIPSIVDEASLGRAYERIGFRSHAGHGVAFDTKEAVAVGEQVIREITLVKTE